MILKTTCLTVFVNYIRNFTLLRSTSTTSHSRRFADISVTEKNPPSTGAAGMRCPSSTPNIQISGSTAELLPELNAEKICAPSVTIGIKRCWVSGAEEGML